MLLCMEIDCTPLPEPVRDATSHTLSVAWVRDLRRQGDVLRRAEQLLRSDRELRWGGPVARLLRDVGDAHEEAESAKGRCEAADLACDAAYWAYRAARLRLLERALLRRVTVIEVAAPTPRVTR